jgi:hypothetical protein
MRYYEGYTDDGTQEITHISKRVVTKWIEEHPGAKGSLVITERDGTLISRTPIENSGHKYRDNRIVSTTTPSGRL